MLHAMADVNEELVRRYYELQGYFVRSNVRYRLKTEKGAGWCHTCPRTSVEEARPST